MKEVPDLVGQIVFQARFQQRLGGGETDVVSLFPDIRTHQFDSVNSNLPVSSQISEFDKQIMQEIPAKSSMALSGPDIPSVSNNINSPLID
jgi:hypothetical protein